MIRPIGSLVLALVVTASAAVPAAAQDSVAGAWLLSLAEPSMGQMTLPVTLMQSGTSVAGTVDMTNLPELEAVELVDGVYEAGVLKIRLDANVQGQWFSTNVEAQVDGDEMTGSIFVPEMGYSFPFTGKRQEG